MVADTVSNHQWFAHHLRKALYALYDPTTLRQSLLIEVLVPASHHDPVIALRQILLDGIEALKPTASTPPESKMWRTYHILRRRYTEQIPQRVVAGDFGLSTRQLQREEKDARQALVYHLWTVYQVEEKLIDLTIEESQDSINAPTRVEELEWLQESVSVQMTDVNDLIREALKMLQPVFVASKIQVVTELDEKLPHLPLRAPLLRQALLSLLGMIIQSAPEGDVIASSRFAPPYVEIRLQATITDEPSASFDPDMTQQMIELCQGTLDITDHPDSFPSLDARITLTIDKPFTVLVIDDNADTQQLFQRYLTGSRFTYIGATTFEDGIALVNQTAPHIVVLDVMMPQHDGWTLLGQLRYQPTTSHIPIIVCTILPQRNLAMALGADDFMRKPVSRSTFLSALNRQADLLTKDID